MSERVPYDQYRLSPDLQVRLYTNLALRMVRLGEIGVRSPLSPTCATRSPGSRSTTSDDG